MTRNELKAKANDLGLEYKDNIPTKKLEELVGWESEDKVERVEASLVTDYFENSPRRLIKLRGLLNRTTDSNERNKIATMINELEG